MSNNYNANQPINPIIEAARVSLGDTNKLSPKYFASDENLKFKYSYNLEVNQENLIPRSASLSAIGKDLVSYDKFFETYKDCIDKQNAEIKSLTLENERLTEMNLYHKRLCEELTINYQRAQIELNKQIELKDAQIKNLKDELCEKDAKITKLNSETNNLNQEIRNLNLRQRQHCSTFELQIEDQNKEMTLLRRELNNLKSAHAESLEQIKESRTSQCQLNQVIACMKNQADTWLNEKRVLTDTITRLNEEKDDMECKLGDIIIENDKLTKLNYNFRNNNDNITRTSSYEYISKNETVFWKRLMTKLKVSSKDSRKKTRLSGNLKSKK